MINKNKIRNPLQDKVGDEVLLQIQIKQAYRKSI